MAFMYNAVMRILIIEDDKSIGEFVEQGLKAEGFAVDRKENGKDGSYTARTGSYDIVVIDYSLPLKNGIEVCGEIRDAGKTMPIIFLSVIGDVKNKIKALERGADDYMTKPFSFEELKSRIRALLRRPKKIENPIIKSGDISINTEKQIAYIKDKPVYLTKKEYNLLEYLMRNMGTIVSRSMIMEHVWDAESDPFSNTVEAHIMNLRKKINSERNFIRNMPGRGYIIDP